MKKINELSCAQSAVGGCEVVAKRINTLSEVGNFFAPESQRTHIFDQHPLPPTTTASKSIVSSRAMDQARIVELLTDYLLAEIACVGGVQWVSRRAGKRVTLNVQRFRGLGLLAVRVERQEGVRTEPLDGD